MKQPNGLLKISSKSFRTFKLIPLLHFHLYGTCRRYQFTKTFRKRNLFKDLCKGDITTNSSFDAPSWTHVRNAYLFFLIGPCLVFQYGRRCHFPRRHSLAHSQQSARGSRNFFYRTVIRLNDVLDNYENAVSNVNTKQIAF